MGFRMKFHLQSLVGADRRFHLFGWPQARAYLANNAERKFAFRW